MIMKQDILSELNEIQLESVCGGAPAGLQSSQVPQPRGVILVIGVVQPAINLSIVVIANTVINAPLTIGARQGIHRL